MTRTRLALAITFSVWLLNPADQGHAKESNVVRQPIKYKNTLASPSDVVGYFTRRDWYANYLDGVPDRERMEYTLWRASRVHENYYIAEAFEIGEPKEWKLPRSVVIPVTFEVTGYADGLGSSMPVKPGKLTREYILQKDNQERWRILFPPPSDMVPVIGEGILRVK